MNAARWAKRSVSIVSLLVVWFIVAIFGPQALPGPIAVAVTFVDYLGNPVYGTQPS